MVTHPASLSAQLSSPPHPPRTLVHLFLAGGSPYFRLLRHYSFPVEAAGLLCAGAAVAGASPVSATGPGATAPPRGLQAPAAPHLPETVDSPWWYTGIEPGSPAL